jgi:predicted transcriptional regulator
MEALERRKSKLRKRVKDKKELKRSLATNSFLVQCRTRDKAQAEEALRRAHLEVHACFTAALLLLYCCFTTAFLVQCRTRDKAQAEEALRRAHLEVHACFTAALLLLYYCFTTALLFCFTTLLRY